MRTRSGKIVHRDPDSTSMAHDNAPHQQQPAQGGRATRASKRARSASHPSALAPETEPDSDIEHPASKASRKKRRREFAAPHVIDLSNDDDELSLEAMSDVKLQDPQPTAEASRHPAREMQGQHGTERVRAGRGGRRGGRSKNDARPAPQSPTTARSQPVAKWFIDDIALSGPDAPTFQMPIRTSRVNKIDREILQATRNEAVPDAPMFQVPDRTPRVEKSGRDVGQETRDEAVTTTTAKAHGAKLQNRSVKAERNIMFTLQEAMEFLKLTREDGIPITSPPYTVQTGEYVPYPVTKSYNLGAMGRYGPEAGSQQPAPRNTVRDSTEYVFDWGSHCGERFSEVPRIYLETILASPRLDRVLEERPGLGEALQGYKPNHPHFATATRPMQHVRHPNTQAHIPKHSSPNDSNAFGMPLSAFANVGQASASATNGMTNTQTRPFDIKHSKPSSEPSFEPDFPHPDPVFVLPFGPFRGLPLKQVPVDYQKLLERDKQAQKTYAGLKEALVESYRFSWGKYKSKPVHHVPIAYLKVLEGNRDKLCNDEILRRALRAGNDRIGRSNATLDKYMDRWNILEE